MPIDLSRLRDCLVKNIYGPTEPKLNFQTLALDKDRVAF